METWTRKEKAIGTKNQTRMRRGYGSPIYDYERAQAAIRAYVARQRGDPEPSGELPWWARGCEPYRERPWLPLIPGESVKRAGAMLSIGVALEKIRDLKPLPYECAILLATPCGYHVDRDTGEIRYNWRSTRDVARLMGIKHGTARGYARTAYRMLCRLLHDPPTDVWLWRPSRRPGTDPVQLPGFEKNRRKSAKPLDIL